MLGRTPLHSAGMINFLWYLRMYLNLKMRKNLVVDLNEKHQPDAVNKYIFHLCSVSTCFGQHIAHHQEINKMYKSAYGVRPVIKNSM